MHIINMPPRLITAEYQLRKQRLRYYKSLNKVSWAEFAEKNTLNIFGIIAFTTFILILSLRHRDNRDKTKDVNERRARQAAQLKL